SAGLHADRLAPRRPPVALARDGYHRSADGWLFGIARLTPSDHSLDACAMKTATGTTIIANGQLVDGTGAGPVPDAALVVVDGRVSYAGPAAGAPPVPPDACRINARGGTIMPGLVEAHFHPTYFNVAALEDLDIKYPVEYVTLLAAANAGLALECG